MPAQQEVIAGANALYKILDEAGYGAFVSMAQCGLAARAVILAVDAVRIQTANQMQLDLDTPRKTA